MFHDESIGQNVNTGSNTPGPAGSSNITGPGHRFGGGASANDNSKNDSQSPNIPTNQLYVPYFDQLDVYIEAIGKAETGGQDTGLVRGESKCKPYNTPPLNGDEGSNDKETLRLPQQKKIDKSKLAFEVDIDTTNFQEPVKSYLSQLENFSRDPKEALQLLKASGGAPIFPEESWPKILSGSFIDFNKHVFREGWLNQKLTGLGFGIPHPLQWNMPLMTNGLSLIPISDTYPTSSSSSNPTSMSTSSTSMSPSASVLPMAKTSFLMIPVDLLTWRQPISVRGDNISSNRSKEEDFVMKCRFPPYL
ncbi:hypothetical protein PQX77_019613 [Marasmius sp. AFHP31]|nr:hypothetical protein PQX77_019613 [Marasmius sp. AFHP31]